MIEKLYDWMLRQAESKNAVRVLMFVSFIESSFFPLPPDPVLAIVVAKNKDKAIRYALLCAIASVLGGFFGYYIGYSFFELIGEKILSFYGQAEKFSDIVATLNKWAFWIICAKGLTPIPYKIVTIASGFAKINLLTFGAASLITRTTRFLLLSLVCRVFGDQFLAFIEKHKKTALTLIVVSVLIGFLLVKLFI
ncbi:MAG: DedA family protein [Holosporaceae bacterium]|jgi:membrane protein YqaA with SNARE-associated domain|nr:DedA family protein [Holosporaceae bacterium]